MGRRKQTGLGRLDEAPNHVGERKSLEFRRFTRSPIFSTSNGSALFWRRRRCCTGLCASERINQKPVELTVKPAQGQKAISNCIVIGAGIAGACAAESLARRGWQVLVLDAAPAPAAGASGLPVGLYAPYQSADNNLTSQITHIGVEFTRDFANRLLLEGTDWQPSGLITRKPGEAPQWHANAGWIKPAAIVQACLNQSGVTWRGNCEVQSLARQGSIWQLLDADEQIIAEASMVVVAASNRSAALLDKIPTAPKLNLQAIRGQVTFGELQAIQAKDRSNVPINGYGSYIQTSDSWLVAASYDRLDLSLDAKITDQVENFERLESLVPDMAAQLKPAFTNGSVKNWVGIRCASSDRLPIVGKVTQGLWVLTALASRGLTFAPLFAEVLAAQIFDENIPLNPRLAQALSVQRYMKK